MKALHVVLGGTGNARQRPEIWQAFAWVSLWCLYLCATARPYPPLYPGLHFALKTCSEACEEAMEITSQTSAVP